MQNVEMHFRSLSFRKDNKIEYICNMEYFVPHVCFLAAQIKRKTISQ